MTLDATAFLDRAFEELQQTSAPDKDAQNLFRDCYFGPYQLLGQLGAGGVARVWRARHVDPRFADEAVAMKLLHAKFSADKRIVNLFRGEALIMSLLCHPHIVRVVDAGELGGRLFIAMEQVAGSDLDELLFQLQEAKQLLPFDLGLYLIMATLRALSFAHGLKGADGRLLQLVHRDVNPANVFVSFDGGVKLGDFGVASIVQAHGQKSTEVAGKLGYFAPEQLEGLPSDHRSDLFAVGVMMFEVLCGHRLFEADAQDQAIRRNARAHAPRPTRLNPSLPSALEPVMLQALERRPQDRFASAEAMLEALAPFADGAVDATMGLRSLLRGLLHKKFIKVTDEQLRWVGRKLPPLMDCTIDLLASDVRTRTGIARLLGQSGARVREHTDIRGVASASDVASSRLLVVDLSDATFSGESVRRAAESRGKKVPTVCLSILYDRSSLARATAMGAQELLVRPMRPERMIDACRRALLTPSGPTAAVDAAASIAASASDEVRAPAFGMVLSRDTGLLGRLAPTLATLHLAYEVTGDEEQALLCGLRRSHSFLIVDAHAAPGKFRETIRAFRGLPGIGLLPVLLLIDEVQRPLLRGVAKDRLVIANRLLKLDVPCAELSASKSNDHRRIFTRHTVRLPGRLRAGGRSEPCVAENISRGGVMLTSRVMPPLGSWVEVDLEGAGQAAVSFRGRVARVALSPSDAGVQDVALGITCAQFAEGGEAAWIGVIATLEAQSKLTAPSNVSGTS